MLQELFKAPLQLDQVGYQFSVALVLDSIFDKDSDYDVYVHLTDLLLPWLPTHILSKYCS